MPGLRGPLEPRQPGRRIARYAVAIEQPLTVYRLGIDDPELCSGRHPGNGVRARPGQDSGKSRRIQPIQVSRRNGSRFNT